MTEILSALVMVGALMTPLWLASYGDKLWKLWECRHTHRGMRSE